MVDGGGWRLAPGVGLVEGTLLDGQGPGQHVYTLVLPSGRRFRVAEPLYRLAELLAGQRSPEEVAAALSARLGRSFGVAEVDGLIETRLAPHGAVRPPED